MRLAERFKDLKSNTKKLLADFYASQGYDLTDLKDLDDDELAVFRDSLKLFDEAMDLYSDLAAEIDSISESNKRIESKLEVLSNKLK